LPEDLPRSLDSQSPPLKTSFLRRPAAGWLIGGILAVLGSALAVMVFLALQTAREDLRASERSFADVRSKLGAAQTRIDSLETRISVARGQLRDCERVESLSVRLWNKHIEEMNANLNSSRSEYERLFAEANALRKRLNRAGRSC
jgi:chromosome segregation ATPase